MMSDRLLTDWPCRMNVIAICPDGGGGVVVGGVVVGGGALRGTSRTCTASTRRA